jgi:hypothetical protein
MITADAKIQSKVTSIKLNKGILFLFAAKTCLLQLNLRLITKLII